jgi:anti-sigma regulatory factor (Ser/Thr protein kinase)
MPVGSTVILYTDGLVEVRGEAVDEGLQRLRHSVAGSPSELERICDRVTREMGAADRTDDIALLAARIVSLGARIVTRWPAHVDALARIRPVLRRWLREQGATEDEVYELTVAVQEACANAVEHAYGPGAGDFDVEARIAAGEVWIVVRDEGRWRGRRGSDRGRGLPLMEALTDAVDVTQGSGGTGTTIELRRRLGGGPRM